MKDAISKVFGKYKKIIVDKHAYYIQSDEKQCDIAHGISKKIVKVKYNKDGHTIISDKYFSRLHPSKIDNKKFWKNAKTHFKLFAVCGAPCKDYRTANTKTLSIPRGYNYLNFINEKINSSKDPLNFFEIGYGHGNIFFEFNEKVNYLGIDYYKNNHLRKFKNLKTISKSGIPKYILNDSQDIIYSVNVLQHCSKTDRLNYIKEAYEKLKPGGYFIFTCFLLTNNNSNFFGIYNNEGTPLTHFLGQFTEVDRAPELISFCEEVGFSIENYQVSKNNAGFILKKINRFL